jgi:methionyl-tRNA synthetase
MGKVLYVWFDAPIGYISGTKDLCDPNLSAEKKTDYYLNESLKPKDNWENIGMQKTQNWFIL